MAQDFESNMHIDDIHHAALEVIIKHADAATGGTLALCFMHVSFFAHFVFFASPCPFQTQNHLAHLATFKQVGDDRR